jgi:MFS superfamily sulfate permease-like transporter
MRTHPAPLFGNRTIALLRHQLLHFEQHVRPGLRFLVAFVCRVLSRVFASVFILLPLGWPKVVAAHLFSLPGIFVAIMLATFAVAAFGLEVLSRKIARTL